MSPQQAAHDELIDAVKRYAKEVADLKWRLAEKDAQLMGGFGAPDRLRVGGCGILPSISKRVLMVVAGPLLWAPSGCVPLASLTVPVCALTWVV